MRGKCGWTTCAILATISGISGHAQQILDIQMGLSKTTVMLGEPVWVDVTVTNRSSDALRIGMGANCFGVRPIKIAIPGAEPAPPQNEFRCYQGVGGSCPSSGPSMLEPGDTLRRSYVLAGDFRITHPGRYHVLLEKEITYAIAAIGENGFDSMRNAASQTAKDEAVLDIREVDPAQLLSLERAIAAEYAKPPSPVPARPAASAQPANSEIREKNRETLAEKQMEAFDAREALAAGLAEYPAAGMEPVFDEWMILGPDTSYYGLKALYNLNTPEARHLIARAADPSEDIYLRWRERWFVPPGKTDEILQEPFENWRAQAIHALARMGDRSYVPLLEKLSSDSSAHVRQEAILDLGLLGGEVELPRLDTLARSGTGGDRQSSVAALGDTDSLKAVPILIDLFSLPDANQPAFSTFSLMTLTHHSVPFDEHRTPAEYQAIWRQWWEQNRSTAQAYGPFECGAQ